MERWTKNNSSRRHLNWEALPQQRSGGVLHRLEQPQRPRQALGGPRLSRLMAESEFHTSHQLRPLELIDEQLGARHASDQQVWTAVHILSALQACSAVQAPPRCGGEGRGQVALVSNAHGLCQCTGRRGTGGPAS